MGLFGYGANNADLATVDTNVDAILVDTGTTLPGTLGTPAGADLATDIAAVKSDTAAVLTDTGTTIPAVLGTPAGADLATDIAAVKSDTAAVLVDTAALDIVKLQHTNANTTAAANAGVTALLTVGVADIWVDAACLVSNGATTADLTNCVVAVINAAGDTALHTIIDATNGAQSALDAAGKRAVASTAAAAEGLPVLVQVGEKLGVTLTGTGATAVDLDVNFRWYASATGATLT